MGRLTTDEPFGVNPGGGGEAEAGSRPSPDERRLTPRVRLRVPRDASAAATARRALESLDHELEHETLETLRLLMTELVTNSVRHADAPDDDIVDVELAVSPDGVRVEVGDGGSGFDATPRPTDHDDASGWGLHLVEELSSRWGVRRTRRTCVWFELERRPPLRGV
jgi:anti-sigma regulatory factor (Ser/Thr protein kinase)